MKTTIYLIRHSETNKDATNYINENDQIKNELTPLSEEGKIKANLFLKSKEFNNIDIVYSSNYLRAQQTAQYLNKKITTDERLCERILGNTEGINDTFWLTQLKDENAKAPLGESAKEVRKRMTKVINEIKEENQGKTVAIITHACAITFYLMNFCKLEHAELKGKIRTLSYQGKTIINEPIYKPSAFKLEFNNNELINISYIKGL